MADIKDIHEGATVLGEFGIKVVGQVESASDLPDPTEYDGEYGDAYVVGEEAPYDYYIFTRPFEDVDDPQWFNLGQFPAPGPQGEQGEQGETGLTPSISVGSFTTTLNAGQNASVSVTRAGPDANPSITFTFGIPQGPQGTQGPRGAQGIQGPAGPQGIQGQKGDTGYLYTIIGQVNDESSLPLPGQVGRTSAFLVGSQEPYDVYIIIGQDSYDLEWLNIGPIATVVPTTYIASDTDASSGTLDATTLAAITNETGVHYIRVGSELYEYANTYNGNAYYMSLRYDSSISRNKIARFIVALSSGAWTTGSDAIPDAEHTVFTNTAQTISGNKTFSGNIYIGDSNIAVNKNSFGNLAVNISGTPRIKVSGTATQFAGHLYPETTGIYDIGLSSGKWKDLWLSGYLRDGTNSILLSDIDTLSGTQTISGTKTFSNVIKASKADVSLVGLNGIAGFRAYKPGTTTSAGQMIVTNDGTVAGSYRAVIQAYNGTQDAYNTLRIGDTEGFKYYVNNDNVFTIGNNGSIIGNGATTGTGLTLKSDDNENCTFTLPKSGDPTMAVPYALTIAPTASGYNNTLLLGEFEEEIYVASSDTLRITAGGNLYMWSEDGCIKVFNLPTSNPLVSDEEENAIWNNNGVLMYAGNYDEPITGMPKFDPGINIGTYGVIGSIPFIEYSDPSAIPTASTITRDVVISLLGGEYEYDSEITFEQNGVIVGSTADLPYSITSIGGRNVVHLTPNILELGDSVFDSLSSESSVSVQIADSDAGMSYIVGNNDDSVWIVPSLAVKLKRNNSYYYIIQTPTDVDGPIATYDLTNITIPSGYTLPDSGSRGLGVAFGDPGDELNGFEMFYGIAMPQDY